MANLVAPVSSMQPLEERIIEFRGLNRKSFVDEGEMSDMKNLTSDNYPLLCPRKLRGQLTLPSGVAQPLKIMTKFERIAMIAKKTDNSIAFFYNGNEVTSVTGLTADTEMVAINTKICFFPQKTYLTLVRGSSSVTVGEFGHLDTSLSLTDAAVAISNTNVKVTVPSGHGIVYDDAIDMIGTLNYSTYKETGTASELELWRTITQSATSVSSVTRRLKVNLSVTSGFSTRWKYLADGKPFTVTGKATISYLNNGTRQTMTHTITHEFTKNSNDYESWESSYGLLQLNYEKNTVTLVFRGDSSTYMTTGTISVYTYAEQQSKACNISCAVEAASATQLTLPRETFIELTGEGVPTATFTGTVKREIPDLKHVIEWNNRLWGVSDADNTIYACKLGDPKNWKYFQGTDLDAFYAQQGTDEKWTGSAAYSGHLIFFKPNSMTKVYGTNPSSFQITNTICYGVEPGSNKSIAIVNDTVFYKSSIGIMAYDGGTPYSISDRFNIKFSDVVGGTEGRKYYASIKTEAGDYELMVLDVDKGLWHKEDDVRFRSCCTLDGRLYFIEDIGTDDFLKDRIYIINPETATETKLQRDWMATFGAFDELIEDRKIYSRMSLRFIAQPGTKVSIFIKMDDGEWELVKKFAYAGTGGETVPIVPRRCDRFSIKVVGTGDCEIKSLTRRFRRGSKVK